MVDGRLYSRNSKHMDRFFQIRLPKNIVRLLFVSIIVYAISLSFFFAGYYPPILFTVSLLAIIGSNIPKFILSPRWILIAYYSLWYTLPLMFATRYQDYTFMEFHERYSYLLLFTSFILGYNIFSFIEAKIEHVEFKSRKAPKHNFEVWSLFLIAIVVLLLSCVIFVQKTGGVGAWIADPGKAFLTREGAGVYTILINFSILFASTLCGYICFINKKYALLIGYTVFLIVLSPIIGSKSRLIHVMILLYLPWILRTRITFKGLILIVVLFFSFFVFGNWLRNKNWITLEELVPYLLNYFDTFEALVLSIKDIEPEWFSSVFLPFNKFLTPFGISDPNVFYDLSSKYTSIYYPHNWKIRATVQWPIETDLYISFYYFFGLPLLGLLYYVVGKIFVMSIRTTRLSYMFVMVCMTLYMLSHLRGSLIIWTDFYWYPFYMVCFVVLYKYKLNYKSYNV